MSRWDRMEVQEAHSGRAYLGGLIATIGVTLLMYVASLAGLPVAKMPDILARVITFNEPFIKGGSTLWFCGLLVYLVSTIIFIPGVYAYWMYSFFHGAPWLRGLQLGIGMWLLVQLWFMPLMGQNVFDVNGPHPAIEMSSQLILWLLYGAMLGNIAGPQQVWRARPHREYNA